MKILPIIASLTLTITLMSCAQKSSDAHGDHTHDESLRLTGYNENFEIFAEATPFVVGEPSEILAHFTHLENFKPLTEGSVTVSLIVGTEGIRQSVQSPARDGIYLFNLKPTTMGTGKLVFDISTPNGSSQITLYNIKIFDNEHDAQHAAIDAAATNVSGVLFTKEQSWKVDFATVELKREPFGPTIRTAAQIQPSQNDQQVVVAKADGVVRFDQSNIVSGKAIRQGQSLFAIESSGMADNNMEVRLSEATAEHRRAKADFERKKELAKDRIVSERELIDSETTFKNAETVLNNLRKNFASGRQAVSSPIAGFVQHVLVRNGEFVAAGQPVMVVSQNRDLLIKAELSPKHFENLPFIVSANIRVMHSGQVFTLEELGGKVLAYGKSTDLNNPLIPVVFQVQNSAGLLPGSFVEMFIKLKTNDYALIVPNSAIVEEMGTHFVFVQITPEFFEKRPIVIGKTDGLNTEIKSGLAVSERIVSKGAIFVKLSQVTGALDTHGHAH